MTTTCAADQGRTTSLSLARLALLVATVLPAGTLLVAAIVRLSLADEARAWLSFPFTGVPAGLSQAAMIFAHNAWLLAVILAATLIAHSARLDRRARHPRPMPRLLVGFCDALLAWLVVSNVLVIGAALGAYGSRMLEAMLPHGPLELAAFAPALSAYLQARHGRLSARRFATIAVIATSLLIAAALLETFVVP
jgi:hypothetical protein